MNTYNQLKQWIKHKYESIKKTSFQAIKSFTATVFKNIINKIKTVNLKTFNNIQIKYKLITMVVISGLIPIILLSTLALDHLNHEIRNEVFKSNELFARMSSDRISDYFRTREGDARIIANSNIIREGLEGFNSFNLTKNEQQEIITTFDAFTSVGIQHYGYTDIFITNMYNEVIYSNQYDEINLAPIAATGEYVNNAMQGQQNWSNIFRNSFIDDNIIVLSTPIHQDSDTADVQPMGTLNIVLNQQAIDQLVTDGINKLGNSADAYLINEQGQLITNTRQTVKNPNLTTNAKIKSLVNHLKTNTQTDETFTYTGIAKTKVIGTFLTTAIGDQTVGLMTEVHQDEILSDYYIIKNKLIIISIIILMISIIIAILLSNQMSQSIKEVSHLTKAIADFKLKSVEENSLKNRKDEIGDLYRDQMKIIKNFKSIITELENSIQKISETTVQLNNNSDISKNASQQISSAIEVIATGSLNQAIDTDRSLDKINTLRTILKSDEKHLEEVTSLTVEVNAMADDGLTIINALEDKTILTKQKNQDVKDSIKTAMKNSKTIEHASEVIRKISEKTKLLSLNASIEAARAGKYGKGFTVIAHEIRKLSDMSKESTQLIDQILSDMTADNKIVTKNIDDLLTLNTAQVEIVDQTKRKYIDIMGSMADVKDMIIALEKSKNEIKLQSNTLEKNISDLSTISNKNASKTDDVLNSVNNQNNSIQDISKIIQRLSNLSTTLKSLINVFTVQEKT